MKIEKKLELRWIILFFLGGRGVGGTEEVNNMGVLYWTIVYRMLICELSSVPHGTEPVYDKIRIQNSLLSSPLPNA